jgi:hypothetical protein
MRILIIVHVVIGAVEVAAVWKHGAKRKAWGSGIGMVGLVLFLTGGLVM